MRILIAEDESGIASFLKQGLEEEAFTVDVADNGKDALRLSTSGDYDLLLLDWMLPGISGIEVCRKFKQSYPETPVIFLTAKDTVDETVFALQAGGNDYVKKPFHFEELLERIRVQLRPKTGEHTLFTLGEIKLNVETHQVLKEHTEIHLTQKEFALLEYLLRNKGRVCRRTRILEHIWDINFNHDTGIIDVYINALRSKLGITGKNSHIQTVRGVGYIAKD